MMFYDETPDGSSYVAGTKADSFLKATAGYGVTAAPMPF